MGNIHFSIIEETIFQHLLLHMQSYPPPNVPRDFVPVHKFSSSCSVSEKPTESHQKPLTSTERSQLLSDQPGTVVFIV